MTSVHNMPRSPFMIKGALIILACTVIVLISISISITDIMTSSDALVPKSVVINDLVHQPSAPREPNNVAIASNDDVQHMNAAPKPALLSLTKLTDIDDAIKEIDNKITNSNLIELANQGTISTEEADRLRELLQDRDKLFEMKMTLVLKDT